jgi:hypothetical protein
LETLSFTKQTPVRQQYDVIVAGAGPAGICAAVTAARMGARVALVERYGVLGGNLTVGGVGPILGMVGKGTIRDELVTLLGVPDNDMIGKTGQVHDIQYAKLAVAEFVNHRNIDVYLQTMVSDALMDGNILKGLLVSSKEGMFALLGKTVIDTTGDGDVAFFAGAEIEKGREDGLMQPVTLEFTVDNVDEARAIACIGDVDEVKLGGERFLDFCKRCGNEGLIPKNLVAVRLHRTTKPGERHVNTTQMNGIDSTSVAALYPAELELRKQIELLVSFLRNQLPGYAQCRYISSGSTVGTRETRRVMGEYVITAEDMAEGKRFPDAVVHNAEFIVDIHNPAGAGQAEDKIQYVAPYDIPYGCFVPRTIDNLLTAGRCISGTHRAHASYRVMSICMAMGQAAGAAAALCAQAGCTPRSLPAAQVQNALRQQGVVLSD